MGIIQRETQRQGLSHLARSVAIFYGSLTGDLPKADIAAIARSPPVNYPAVTAGAGKSYPFDFGSGSRFRLT